MPGAPEDVVKVKESYTGQYLRPVLARSAASGRLREAESEGANKRAESESANKKSKRQAAE